MASYTALGVTHEITLQPLSTLAEHPQFLTRGTHMAAARRAADSTPSFLERIAGAQRLSSRVPEAGQLAVVQGSVAARAVTGTRSAGQTDISSLVTMTLATQTVIAEGMRQDDFAAAKNYGAEVIEEALDGKVLLRVDTVERAFGLIQLLLKREVGSVSPNFIRRVNRAAPSAAAAGWSLAKINAAAAWQITKGRAEVRVAVLDEGVDTTHPALRHAVFAERDFIGNNGNSAMPDDNDAHGTACAGIVVSKSKRYPGIAPGCQLIAARIGMGDGAGGWMFDDFATADAIDWSWRQGAAVLSNSWGGGAPSDAISRAFARARTQGRGGLGAVVAIAAGNDQQSIDFPGNLPGYVTVGASTPADERKTKSSSDGETGWGSNFGAALHLLAPGVFIWTTDIAGPAGYAPGNFTETFNGTSSSTPAVAAAAALMISANPALSASSVRNLLSQTARKIAGQTGWTKELGWGRLDVGKAVVAAKAAGSVPVGGVGTAAEKTAKRVARSGGASARAAKKATKGATKKTAERGR